MQLLHFGCWWYSYGEVCKKFSGTRQVSSTHSPAVYPKKASTYDMHRDSAACTFSSLYQKIRGTFDKTLFIGHTATKRVFLLTSLKQPFLSSTVWFWRRKLRPWFCRDPTWRAFFGLLVHTCCHVEFWTIRELHSPTSLGLIKVVCCL